MSSRCMRNATAYSAGSKTPHVRFRAITVRHAFRKLPTLGNINPQTAQAPVIVSEYRSTYQESILERIPFVDDPVGESTNVG